MIPAYTFHEIVSRTIVEFQIQIVDTLQPLRTLVNTGFFAGTTQFDRTLLKWIDQKADDGIPRLGIDVIHPVIVLGIGHQPTPLGLVK